MAHRENTCHWCSGSFKFQPVQEKGKHFCSNSCAGRYADWYKNYEQSVRLQPRVEEADACTCRDCRGP